VEEKVDVFTFSKKGDQGETSLLMGGRVSKASLRPEAYGTLDEAASALGLGKVFTQNPTIVDILTGIQRDLLVLGAELSCEDPERGNCRIVEDQIEQLERWIESLQREVPFPREFVLPGGNPASAAIDLGRTMIRRAERRVVAMREGGLTVRPQVHAYLNRLADLLFTLARYAEKLA
jgi:cob(I)alamin adenosyltransferase